MQYRPNKDHDYPHGLVIMYGDHNCQTHRRIIILHLSTVDSAQLNELTSKVIKFIWNYLPYKEIRIGIRHFANTEGIYSTDQDITNAYKDMQFRWKTLINDGNERITFFGLNRPEGVVPSRVYPETGLLFIRSYIITALSSQRIPIHSSTDNKYSIIPLLYCLKETVLSIESTDISDNLKALLKSVETEVSG